MQICTRSWLTHWSFQDLFQQLSEDPPTASTSLASPLPNPSARIALSIVTDLLTVFCSTDSPLTEVASKSFTDCKELSCSQDLPVHSKLTANMCCTNFHLHIEPQPHEQKRVLKEFTARTGTGWIHGFGAQMKVTRHRYQHAADWKDLFTHTSTLTAILRMDVLARIHSTYSPWGYTNLLETTAPSTYNFSANDSPHQG